MTTEIIKSTAITNYDAVPVTRNASGGPGGDYTPRKIQGIVHITTGMSASASNYYRLARVRSDVKIKSIKLWLDTAGTTITGDLGIWYSDSKNQDGTSNVNNAGAAIVDDLFMSAVALAAIVVPTEYAYGSTYLGADAALPIWNATNSTLTSDPGGFFDIVFLNSSTTGSAADLNFVVEYAP